MSATEIKEMKERQAGLVKQARTILSGAGEKVPAEKQEQIDRIMEDVRSLRKSIQITEELEGYAPDLSQYLDTDDSDGDGDGQVIEGRQNGGPGQERGIRLPDGSTWADDNGSFDISPSKERAALKMAEKPEYGRAFYRWARMGVEGLRVADEKVLQDTRALVEGTDAQGGYIAPTQLIQGVQRGAQDLEQLRPRMLVATTNSKSITITEEADAVQMDWVAELGAKPEDQPAFGQRVINAHVGAVVVWVSDELLEDTSFGLEAYLSTLAAEGKVELEETAFAAGTGAGQPFGILTRINGQTGTPNRYTTAAIGALSADDLKRAFYALRLRYRRRAAWVLGTNAVLAVQLLKDSNGQYIWQPGLQAGQPDRVVGAPLIENEAAAINNAVASGNDIGFVGDLKRYTVLQRLAMQVKRLEELRAMTDEVGFRFRFRTGGDVQTTQAFRSIRVQ